jgi:hypothetical protein
MEITGIHLATSGNKIEVNVEYNGEWYQIIKEVNSGPISWITEERGILQKISQKKRPSHYEFRGRQN